MSWMDMRPPPCPRCGVVDPPPSAIPFGVIAPRRHVCNPTQVQAMRLGATTVGAIGGAIRDAFAVFTERTDG